MTVIPDRLQLLDRKRLTDGLCDNCARKRPSVPRRLEGIDR